MSDLARSEGASGYTRLVELGERALALAEAADVDALEELDRELAALVAALPADPPAEALPQLERAAALQAARTAALTRAREAVAGDVRRLAGGRRTARTYAPPAAPAAPLIDRAG